MKKKWIVGVTVALVVIAGVAAVYKPKRPSSGTKDLSGQRIGATFLTYQLRSETAAEIKTGTPIYDETDKECFTIGGITSSPSQTDAIDSKGELRVVGHSPRGSREPVCG
jgi:hypothetical protein